MSEKQQNLRIGKIIVMGVNDQQAKILTGRQAFVEKSCEDRGWDMSNITVEQVLIIRSQSGWKNPA